MIQPGSSTTRSGWQLPALAAAALVVALAAALVAPLAYFAAALAALVLVAAYLTDAAAVRRAAMALCAAIIVYPALLPRRSIGYITVAGGGEFGVRAQVQLVFVAGIAALAGLLWLITPGSIAAFRRGTMRLLLLYGGLALLSLTYTPDREWAGFALLKLLEAIVLLAVLAPLVRTEQQVRRFVNVVLAACGFLLVAYWPDIISGALGDTESRARNAWIHPNSASLIAFTVATMLGARALAAPTQRDLWRAAIPAALAALTGLLAAGKSALGAGLLAIAFIAAVAVLRRSPGAAGRSLALGFVALSIGGLFVAADLGIARHLRAYTGSEYGEAFTLTGRIPLWEVALARGAERPILGHGYMSTFAQELDNGLYWQSAQAHNTVIQSYVDLGLVGAVVVVLIYVVAWRGALAQTFRRRVATPRWRLSLELLAGLAVLSVTSLTEDVFGGYFEIRTMIFLAVLFAIDRLNRIEQPGQSGV